jgi:hypothetical protein
MHAAGRSNMPVQAVGDAVDVELGENVDLPASASYAAVACEARRSAAPISFVLLVRRSSRATFAPFQCANRTTASHWQVARWRSASSGLSVTSTPSALACSSNDRTGAATRAA